MKWKKLCCPSQLLGFSQSRGLVVNNGVGGSPNPGEQANIPRVWQMQPSSRTGIRKKEVLCYWSSLVTQLVKNLPAMQETWVRSLGWEDPLEEGMATRSGTLAWRISMNRGAWGATVHRVAKTPARLSN